MRKVLFAIFIFQYALVSSQVDSNNRYYTVSGLVVDTMSMEPIPFVSIYKKDDRNGTISNFEGKFVLENVKSSDTIVFSYTGYEKRHVSGADAQLRETFFMLKEAQLVEQVVVLGDNSFLYELISKCKRRDNMHSQQAKSYLELHSFQGKKQVELYESYYNTSFKGYDISDLEMKTARLTLAPLSNRLFSCAADISQLIDKQYLFEESEFFPGNPFYLKKKELRDIYSLKLLNKYKDDANNTIYVVDYYPNQDEDKYFRGTVWIDSATNAIVKVNFNIKNASRVPFISFFGGLNKLDSVDLDITKTYIPAKRKKWRLQSVNFNYAFNYERDVDSILRGKILPDEERNIRISAEAILYAYDYDHSFILPYFDFQEGSYADFLRMSAIQDNPVFWECLKEFKANTDENRNDLFVADNTNVPGRKFLGGEYNTFQDSWSHLRWFYLKWQGDKRLRIWDIDPEPIPSDSTIGRMGFYNLCAQLYLDVNETCDSVQVITRTLFDPYKTYYRYPMTLETDAFINIYFDLMEIQRRKLDARIRECGNDTKLIQRTFIYYKKESENLTYKYFREVDRGTKREALKWWNDLVVKELGIDNFAIYGLYQMPEEGLPEK